MVKGSNHRKESGLWMIRAPIFILIWTLFPFGLIAQHTGGAEKDPPDPVFDIRWIGQFPEEGSEDRTSFRDRISGILFGQKPQEIIKPFNVVATDPMAYWILDQGSGAIVRQNQGEGEFLKCMRDETHTFPSLVGLCQLPDEDLLFTDSRTNQVYLISNGRLSAWADLISLQQPTGIAYSSATDQIWVVETAAHRITVLSRDGEVIRQIGERGSDPASFNFPTFIWIDRYGRVYVVDSMNFRVQILDSNGDFLASFGESGDATGNMARPKGVATDSYGNIYVADALFHVVQVFNREGQFLHSFGKQGQGSGEFWMPAGIYIDGEDHIYVADSYNARIQVFQLVKI